ncbi:MAG TPA: response regulator [Geobacteraceae bacterium]|nr:response regulator [Geobacteraceae bacterium]
MSLVGNLEDLGLGEILQIVSLSRKSGSLSLYSRGREGKIVFRNGQVVRASSASFQQNLGEILIQKGVIDSPTLKSAIAIQQRSDSRERLGSILVKNFKVPVTVVEDVVREQIERVVYSLFAWAEGTFDFELQDNNADLDVTHLDPMQFKLEQGLNPQFLAIEGSRIIDEMRHRGELADDSEAAGLDGDPLGPEENIDLAFDLLQQPAEAPATEAGPAVAQTPEQVEKPEEPESRSVILVDDDPATREYLGELLGRREYAVIPFEKSEDALIYIDTVFRAGKRPLVLVDLIMPRMDGSGILGGLELLELVHTNFPDLKVLVMADYNNTDAEKTVNGMGYPFLIKPRKASLDNMEIMGPFGVKLLAGLDRLAPGASRDDSWDTIDLGEELRMEMGEELAPAHAPSVRSTGITLLRGILEELNNPSLGGGIILLVLRFASEFMNRAVIFIVKRDEIVGLGQFGIDDGSGKANAKVRNIRIPLGEESVFGEVVEKQLTVRAAGDGSRWISYLFEQLGEGVPGEFFLGPIISEGKVVALLYGDNLPENESIGDTDSLEIFLSQAGMAMEKALLQRKLKEKNQEGN